MTWGRPAILTLLLVWLSALMCGCQVDIVGRPIMGPIVAFVQDGVTPRSEVLRKLGKPLYELEAGRTIAYTWESNRNAYYTTYPTDRHYLGRKRHGFCVRFNDRGVVVRHGEIVCEGVEPWESALHRWAVSP